MITHISESAIHGNRNKNVIIVIDNWAYNNVIVFLIHIKYENQNSFESHESKKKLNVC